MAEECVRLPDSPDVSRSWRRISTGRLSLLYSEERVLPNYLRASAGSCHDVCKYGKKHESEEKARGSTLKRFARELSRDKILRQSLDSPLMERTLAKKVSKPSFTSAKCDTNGSDVKSESEARKFPSRAGDVKKKEAATRVPREGLGSANNKNSPEKMKKKAASSSESRLGNSITRKQVPRASKRVFLPSGRAPSGSKQITEHNKRVTVSKLKSCAEKGATVQRSRSENNTVTRKKIGVPKQDLKKAILPGKATLSRKSLPDKSDNVKVKQGSSLSVPPLRNRKAVKATEAEKLGLNARGRKDHKDLVEEKTLYVIKMETENAIVESAQNQRCVIDLPTTDPSSSSSPERLSCGRKSQEEPECTVTEAEDGSSGDQEEPDFAVTEGKEEDHPDDKDGDDESLHGAEKVERQRKNRAFSSGDPTNEKAIKLKFKRGKIVDAASRDKSPRRLKFKRGTVLAGDETTPKSGWRRSFKTKGSHLNNEEHKPRMMKVALRHQDTKRKNGSGGLFNNVIEETASKLVETRKSKVKALVGAFETVISLQETKPSAT